MSTITSDYTWDDDMDKSDSSSISIYLSPSQRPSNNLYLQPGDIAAIAKQAHRPVVKVHLPPFWPTRPAAWFGAAEAAFGPLSASASLAALLSGGS